MVSPGLHGLDIDICSWVNYHHYPINIFRVSRQNAETDASEFFEYVFLQYHILDDIICMMILYA